MATTHGFICYARDDLAMVSELRTNLAAVEEDYGVTFWQDRDLRGGDIWNEEIAQAIGRASIFLLLLSPAWRASAYIRKHERPAIQARDGCLVVPVILKRGEWATVIGKLHAVPSDGRVKAIADWERPDHGFAAATAEIGAAVQKFLGRGPFVQTWSKVFAAEQPDPGGPVWRTDGSRLALVEEGDQSDRIVASDAVTGTLHRSVQERTAALRDRIRREANRIGSGWKSLTDAARDFAAEIGRDTADIVPHIGAVWRAYDDLQSCWQRHLERIDGAESLDEPLPAEIARDLGDLIRHAAPFVHQFPTGVALDADAPPVGDALADSVAAFLDAAEGEELIPLAATKLLHDALRKRDSGKAGHYAAVGGHNLLVKICGVLAAANVRPADDATLLGRAKRTLTEIGDRLQPILARFPEPFREAFTEAVTAHWVAASPAVVRRGPKPGTVERDGPLYPEMVLLPEGEFVQGVPDAEEEREKFSEQRRGWAAPCHRVMIPEPFWMATYPVTRGAFAVFVAETGRDMGNSAWTFERGWKLVREYKERPNRGWRNPGFRQTDRHPVVCVSHDDAVAYTEWLSRRTGNAYRLPSESEWEYAARAGTTTARYWGDGFGGAARYAWSGQTTGTAPVDSARLPNDFGLHDMLGNVWEWCADSWHGNYQGAPDDGSAWGINGNDGRCVLRGGSWSYNPRNVRAGVRSIIDRGSRNNYAGFRLSRTL